MSNADSMKHDGKRLRIRKYSNRRYYESTRSQHMTLEEIYAAIRDGYEIEVTDSKSGQDITAKVLTQMIIELDPPKLGVFPVPLLHRLLRANEQLVNDFTQKYFSQALDAFLDSQKKFEQSLRTAMGLKASTPTVADWTRMMWGPFAPTTRDREAEPGGGAPAGQSVGSPSTNDVRQVVDQLRRQVDELKQQLARPKRQTTTRTTRKRSTRR
jgi:polyhydroxyalkanoate synthesis repressor PhaR